MSERKRRPRTRLSRGVFVSLCLAATLVLVVGTGMFFSHATNKQSSDEPAPTNFSEPVVEVNEVEEESSPPFEIVSDPDYGEYEKGKVLVSIDETTDLAQLESVLESNDVIYTKSVADQNSAAGFVQVEFNSDESLKNVLELFERSGFSAQPNYVYHPAEEVTAVDGSAVDGLTAEDAQESAAAEEESAEGSSDGERTSVENAAPDVHSDEDISVASEVQVNDPGASQQWALGSLDVYRAWGIAKSKEDNATSPKVSVAVVDTGCLVTHEDLVGNVRATYNSETDQLGIDQVTDSIGHGTHVAGIVSADANNAKGAAGVSYDAGLVIIKASQGETKDFTTATLAQAYAWLMTSNSTQTNAESHNVRVVNMSVGGKGSVNRDNVLYKNITKAKEAGILTVCAAGNADASAVPPYECIPGDYEDCLTVINLIRGNSSTQPNDSSGTYYVERSTNSNYNVESGEFSQAKNVSAPGSGIYSTTKYGSDSYGDMSGTSMASPAVAGVAALMFAYDPSLSAEQAREILEQTATDLGAEGWDRETGYGEIDAYYALQVLSAQIATTSSLEETAPLVLCSADGVNLDISEWNWQSSNTDVLTVDSDAGTVTPVGIGSATLTATHKKIAGRSVSKQIRVGSATLSEVRVSEIPEQTYTGQPIRPKPALVSSDGVRLRENVDYTIAYENNTEPGVQSALAIITGMGSYQGTLKIPFSIIESFDNVQVGEIEGTCVYNGSAQTPTLSLTWNGKPLAAEAYELSYSNNTDATDCATVTVRGINAWNKGSEVTRTFKILAKPLDGALVSGIKDPTANGSVQTQDSLQVRLDGVYLKQGDNATTGDYVISYRDAKTHASTTPQAAGEYELVITGINNYRGELVHTFTIHENPSGSSGSSDVSGGANAGTSSGNTSASGNVPGESVDSGSLPLEAQPLPQASAVAGTWKKTAGKWWFAYDASTQATQAKPWPANEWVIVKGKYYHFDGRGYMNTGWYWAGDRWYYFGSDGAMKMGWQKVKGMWYYLASNGTMLTGKRTIDGKIYYLNPSSGAMKVGWSKESAGWYYYSKSGAQSSGWVKVGRTWYYLSPADGVMQTGWLDVGGQRYFLRPTSGAMLTGWARIDGTWYHFTGSGALEKNRWIGNYYVGSDGAMATSTWIGNYHVNANGKWDATRR